MDRIIRRKILGISASLTNPFEDAGITPRIRHHAHGLEVPCGICDAPPAQRPQAGVFPESFRPQDPSRPDPSGRVAGEQQP